MATTAQNEVKAPKAAKEAKPPVAVVTRIIDQMKRGALQGKLSAVELDQVAALAASLKVFVES